MFEAEPNNRMLFFTTAIAILYPFVLWYFIKKQKSILNARQTIALIWTHFFLLFLCSILVWLSTEFGISLRGIWSSRIFGWLFIASGILIFPIGYKPEFSNLVMKLYFFLFSALSTIFGILLLLPFAGTVIGYSVLFRLTGTGDTIFYNDNNIRVQNTFTGMLGPPKLEVYKKEGLIERTVYVADGGWYFIDSVKTETKIDSILVFIYHDNSEESGSPIKVSMKR